MLCVFYKASFSNVWGVDWNNQRDKRVFLWLSHLVLALTQFHFRQWCNYASLSVSFQAANGQGFLCGIKAHEPFGARCWHCVQWFDVDIDSTELFVTLCECFCRASCSFQGVLERDQRPTSSPRSVWLQLQTKIRRWFVNYLVINYVEGIWEDEAGSALKAVWVRETHAISGQFHSFLAVASLWILIVSTLRRDAGFEKLFQKNTVLKVLKCLAVCSDKGSMFCQWW